MLVTMSILCSCGNYAMSVRNGDETVYIKDTALDLGKEFGLNILTFMILFNSFIPIR
jgi:phospholipid-transporting ATPase